MKTNRFDDLSLSSSTLQAVDAAGYEIPTEIQRRTIPHLLSGSDVLATAQTGTGKTAAFVLPLLERIERVADGTPTSPAALILTPTRELAVQIVDSVGTYGRDAGLRCVAIFGGASRNRQIGELRRGTDIVVATPGRLLDLIGEGHLSLNEVSYLVLDEADRMLDMGFIPAVRRIVGMTPDTRQTALFSATMPAAIDKLAREFLRAPARVQAEGGELRIDRIDQSVMYVEQARKLELLPQLIRDRGMFRVLVFTRTKHRARKVAKILAREQLASDSIHGDKGQSARQRALEAFRDGKIQVLVATDVASRGIDVDDITHVINFELPNEPETYVHRIGRTARAGSEGSAVSLCDESEMTYVRDIERLMGATLVLDRDQPFHQERAALERGRSQNPRSGQTRTRNTTDPRHRGNTTQQRSTSGRRRRSRRR